MKSMAPKKCKDESRMLRELLETAGDLSDFEVISRVDLEELRILTKVIAAPCSSPKLESLLPRQARKPTVHK